MVLGRALDRMSASQRRKTYEMMNDVGKRGDELEEIRTMLRPEEDFATFVECTDGSDAGRRVLGLTDRRLIVVKKSRRGEVQAESIPFSEMLFGGFRRTRMFGRYDIWHGRVERHFNGNDKDVMQAFSLATQQTYEAWEATGSRTPNSNESISEDALVESQDDEGLSAEQPTNRALLDDLERLAELWERQALTDSEYEAAKRVLLG